MGLSITRDQFRPEDYVRFSQRLTECLDVLAQMLAEPDFGGDVSSWGAELELYLVDARGAAAHRNAQVLEAVDDAHFTPELNRFNLEYNSRPVVASATPLSTLEADFESAMERLRHTMAGSGAAPMAIGILPTLIEQDFGLEHMTDLPRYHALTSALKQVGSGDFRVHINGEPPLQMTRDDVTFEGANTSFQVHYRVKPSRFAALYNGLLLATPIVLGIAGNSPTFFGHRLWDETRVPLFKHSIDSRPRSTDWRAPARVSLGHGYLRHSAYELFAESVAIHPLLLPVCAEGDYAAQWQRGEAPGLDELRMHQNTIWSWLRPVYDPADGGHLRIELRALPAGPSIVDMLANAAFYIGLGEAFTERIEQMLPTIPFHYAKYNFYRAAQFGAGAQLAWPILSRHCLESRQLGSLAAGLLPLAREGLQRAGVAKAEIELYLAVIEERIANGQTGAVWQLRQLERMNSPWPAPASALATLVAGYRERQNAGLPVAQWSDL